MAPVKILSCTHRIARNAPDLWHRSRFRLEISRHFAGLSILQPVRLQFVEQYFRLPPRFKEGGIGPLHTGHPIKIISSTSHQN